MFFNQEYILSLISEIYDEISFDDKEGDDHITILLRHELNKQASILGHPVCLDKSQIYFNNWLGDKKIP